MPRFWSIKWQPPKQFRLAEPPQVSPIQHQYKVTEDNRAINYHYLYYGGTQNPGLESGPLKLSYMQTQR